MTDISVSYSRLYPVKHYIKEAKKLKHKADAEVRLQTHPGCVHSCLFFLNHVMVMRYNYVYTVCVFGRPSISSPIRSVRPSAIWRRPCSLPRAASPWKRSRRPQSPRTRCTKTRWSSLSKRLGVRSICSAPSG